MDHVGEFGKNITSDKRLKFKTYMVFLFFFHPNINRVLVLSTKIYTFYFLLSVYRYVLFNFSLTITRLKFLVIICIIIFWIKNVSVEKSKSFRFIRLTQYKVC